MPAITELEEKAMPTIQLTAVEKTLKRLLLDVAQYIESSQSSPRRPAGAAETSSIVLRFTGGWVRDKLLGVDSQDIDVAINNMTGYQFALKMQEYLRTGDNARKYDSRDPEFSQDSPAKPGAPRKGNQFEGLGSLHKIEANPEKSKHLETVTTRVFGLAIDLVNLRKEHYTEDSRNPQMEFGTPEEDALRRDATVNAMFYNLNTSTVEDFTEQGLKDMQLRVIRTPMEPHQTFMDDPLRVLRLIRFASRLGYTIDPETELAMNDDDVRTALRIKISRERIGMELEKMLKGPDPHAALSLIDRLNLYLTIFPEPETATNLRPHMDQWKRAFDFVEFFMDTPETQSSGDDSLQTVRSFLLRDVRDRYNAWLLVTIFPWASVPTEDHVNPGSKPGLPLSTIVVKAGIKAPNKDCEIITSACRNASAIARLQREAMTQTEVPKSPDRTTAYLRRDTLGMAIHRWGPTWRSQVLLALLLDLFSQTPDELSNDSNSVLDGYAVFLRYIREWDLLEAYLMKPLLNGNELAAALKAKPGPWMGEALELVMAWQLRNPGVTDTKGAIEEVEKHRESLRIQ
ncbi:MAG: CCA tRNA nucleotidyltransferase, mitochondrial [Peltula sp. TS41687]|nr:MAG: CCA tRNA nucleotidyltransferase, mitochondrial [Peltula sp. TS41687]